MTEDIKKLLAECGCTDEYEVCLKYLRECYPDLCIDCVYQDDYYIEGKDAFIKNAIKCLASKKNNE
jgi:hypothetical protein